MLHIINGQIILMAHINTHGWDRIVYKTLVGQLEGKEDSEDLGVNEKVLKMIIKK
jgi:hypothetical protein